MESEWAETKAINYASATKDTFMNNIYEKQRIHKREVELLQPEITYLRKENVNYEDRLKERDKYIAELEAKLNINNVVSTEND